MIPHPTHSHHITPQYVIHTGEVISKVADMCLTAGWPMLTSAAFEDPEGKVVVVLLNEATVQTEVILKDSEKGNMKYGINARSMQTITY